MANELTEVRLLSVPLESDYKHTLYFNSKTDQYNYFIGKQKHVFPECSYQRDEGIVRVPANFELLQDCNYLMFKNKEIGRVYFCFITDFKYKNPGLTEVSFTVDVLQTFMWEYQIRTSFVEREHVKDDVVGHHTLSEDLEIGDYISSYHFQSNIFSSLHIVVAVTKLHYSSGDWAPCSQVYNNLFGGVCYRAFPYTLDGMDKALGLLQYYDKAGHGDDVQCVFLAPSSLIEYTDTYTGLVSDDTFGGFVKPKSEIWEYYINQKPPEGSTAETNNMYAVMGFRTNNVDGYTPKNNKLLCHPFRYMLVCNNNGVSVPFKFEDFWTPGESFENRVSIDPQFKIEGCLSPGCSVRMVPLNFKGSGRNDEEGVNLGKFPALNWSSDIYTNWLTQNAVNIGIDITSNVLMTALGVAGAVAAPATGGASLGLTALAAGNAVVQGVTGITSTMAEKHKASMMPAQSKGNTNAGDIITVSGQNDFHFYEMTIKGEYAKIVDSYFDMFGYKINQIKIPEKNHRKAYWYTKTIDASIYGDIPAPELQIIRNCYNNGITFWRNPEKIGDYTQDNEIVG